jgi:uncharacterized protein
MKVQTRSVTILVSALLALVHLGCSSVLYHPSRALFVDPKSLSPAPVDVQFALNDPKLTIHGWRFAASKQPARAQILYFHGNGQNRSAQFFNLFWLVERGFDLVVYDYPGYGQSAGSPSPESTVKMAAEALRTVTRERPDLPLIVYGQSLGGAVSMRALWEVRDSIQPDLVVIEASFVSYQAAARSVMSSSWMLSWLRPLTYVLIPDGWAPRARWSEVPARQVVVIHSRADEMIKFYLGEEVFRLAPSPKELWDKPTGSHNETFLGPDGEVLKKRLIDLLNQRFARR